jgi:hypothetical protein
MLIGVINIITLLENAWTNHYNEPLNLTSSGLHITQTIHDFVEWANPTRNSPKWLCNERQWWFKNFLLEMPLGMVEFFLFHFSNHLGGFF